MSGFSIWVSTLTLMLLPYAPTPRAVTVRTTPAVESSRSMVAASAALPTTRATYSRPPPCAKNSSAESFVVMPATKLRSLGAYFLVNSSIFWTMSSVLGCVGPYSVTPTMKPVPTFVGMELGGAVSRVATFTPGLTIHPLLSWTFLMFVASSLQRSSPHRSYDERDRRSAPQLRGGSDRPV